MCFIILEKKRLYMDLPFDFHIFSATVELILIVRHAFFYSYR